MRRPTRSVAVLAVTAALLAGCGGDDDAEGTTAPSAPSASTTPADSVPDMSLAPATTVAVPDIDLPDELPTELVVTELRPGGCRESQDGDTVIVNYVGVRSEDGTQFDSNFGGDPLPVTLGTGGVIDGWEQGLVGVQQGERLQLDIPADLAYGDQPRGDVIQAGDALTFLIDVLTVVPASDAADAPADLDLPMANGATEIVIDDLVEGSAEEGCPVAAIGDTAIVQLIAARADNGKVLQSSWEGSGPQAITIGEGSMLPGLVDGIVGMRPGGRRLVTIPYADAFGDEGYPGMGLPPKTDLSVVIDLLAVF